jgi:hypothetical protein
MLTSLSLWICSKLLIPGLGSVFNFEQTTDLEPFTMI